MCGEAVGDELHMALECPCYAAVRQRHASLFTMFEGEMVMLGQQASAAQFRQWLLQDQYLIASFSYECSQMIWSDPPDDLIFAECMSLDGDDEILSDVFLDALSDSFDVENGFAP
jgi:hypothetical protein